MSRQQSMAETRQLCARRTLAAGQRASRRTSPTSPTRRRSCASATRSPRSTTPTRSTCSSTTPASAAAAACSANSRAQWEKTFDVCWGGVYLCTRAFLPLLVKADEAHIVNTSSVNGFWASLGPGVPHTAYSAAKFAVKGFTEALITDLARERPARQVLGRHARPHRHVDRLQLAQDPVRHRLRHHEPGGDRASAGAPVGCGRDMSQVSDADIQKLCGRARAADSATRPR